jgi:sigma-E factor negative regulatory protein RseC
MKKEVYHSGIIENIDGSTLYVRIEQATACNSCQAKRLCMAADSAVKIITVDVDDPSKFEIGSKVEVSGESELGLRAVWWAFVLPLIILLFFLIFLIYLTRDELISSFGSIALLIPYYYILWLKRNKFKNKFAFSIK